MDPDLLNLLLITLVAATIADISMAFGVLPFFFIKNMSKRLTGMFSAGAGGMMAAASLVQLVGEGLDRAPNWQAWEVAAGLAAGAAFYWMAVKWVSNNGDFDIANLRKSGGRRALLIVAAMTVHSLPEGVAIGVAFGADFRSDGTLPTLGLSIASALAVHNIPEAIAITLALMSAGLSVKACLFWALFTSLPQPLAAPFAAWFVWLFEPLLPFGMGLAAGAMVFLVVDDLIPEALKKANSTLVSVAFVGGVVVMIVLGRLVGL